MYDSCYQLENCNIITWGLIAAVVKKKLKAQVYYQWWYNAMQVFFQNYFSPKRHKSWVFVMTSYKLQGNDSIAKKLEKEKINANNQTHSPPKVNNSK